MNSNRWSGSGSQHTQTDADDNGTDVYIGLCIKCFNRLMMQTLNGNNEFLSRTKTDSTKVTSNSS